MRISILGGGLTGLTAAYYLKQSGHEVTVIEKGVRWGGLAGGFKQNHWEWELERTYHHIFKNDTSILKLAEEMGFNEFSFSTPTTSSLFGVKNNYRIFPVDNPQDFLLLPNLSFISKIRAGFTLLFLKITPFLSVFEKMSAADFLRKTMGEEVWRVLWQQLFRNKYGKYAEKIVASFIWARIHKRTQALGYPRGGFQAFIDVLVAKNQQQKVVLLNATTIESIHKAGKQYEVLTIDDNGENKTVISDLILSTLPYPISCVVMKQVLGESYVAEQGKRKYLFAVNLILKSKKPILSRTYWLNISSKDIPIMCVVQHTNFVSSTHYGGDEICYVGWYVDAESELLKMTGEEAVKTMLPHLRAISPEFTETPEVVGFYKAPYAQPIFDSEFTKIPRGFTTPAKNIYIANMDMTYPFDRGTNYAVQSGKDVSNFIQSYL